ncbi:MAG: DUF1800 domain-containing protein [Anaerolineae bacterium]
MNRLLNQRLDRRQFLQTFGVGVVAAAPLARALAALPAGALVPQARDPGAHAIARLTFGITPQLYTHVKQIGAEAFIAEQLQPEALDDAATDELMDAYAEILGENGGVLLQKYAAMRQVVAGALLASWLIHATWSERQLHERMVQFFSNHFHIYIGKEVSLFLKIDDERDVIRPNAMTRFRQLLGASAHSPAMLLYLDNAESTRDVPNENYARELMELHTLSVDGGYTETDVKEVARCFTGWSVDRPRDTTDGSIRYRFRRLLHDNNAKTVLGVEIPAGGAEQDGETVLDMLASHPATARFVSAKIARRFVSDDPPAALVDQLAATFAQSGGDVRQILQTLFAADEFWDAPPKLKQPFEYVVSVLRALHFEITNNRHFLRAVSDPLASMGQIPLTWPSPNGFPDVQDEWMGSLLERWNVAMGAVSNKIPGVRMDFAPILDLMEAEGVGMNVDEMLAFMGTYLLGRVLTDDEQAASVDFARSVSDDFETQFAAGTALLLASPAFQYR